MDVRSAVGIWQDRFASPRVARLTHPIGDQGESILPRHALEASARALGSLPDGWIPQTIGAVDTLAEAAHLRADVPIGDRVRLGAVDGRNAAVLDRDVEAAPVRTVERTGCLNDVLGGEGWRGLHGSKSIADRAGDVSLTVRRT